MDIYRFNMGISSQTTILMYDTGQDRAVVSFGGATNGCE
jgi:hypothetical protein